jgi:histidinol-phosphatase
MRAFSLAEDLALAHRLADVADAITLERYQALDLVVETKPDLTPVTDADKAVEQAIREILANERPDDFIVGEEFGGLPTGNQHYWVIDPIDGTKNFLRGIPTWATLIGFSTPQNEVVVGVVSSLALFRRWHASAGAGAYVSVNKAPAKKIHVSQVATLSDASLSYSDLVGWGERRDAFLKLQEKIWRTRGLGDFWSHMLVAEGSVDIAVEPSLALWDMAALDIIVREAGGTFTNIDGVPGSHGKSGVSSNGLLHMDFLKAISPESSK